MELVLVLLIMAAMATLRVAEHAKSKVRARRAIERRKGLRLVK